MIAKRLFGRFVETSRSWNFEPSILSSQETAFTGGVLLPRVRDWVGSLGHRSLSLRADGGVPPGAISLAGLDFVPDLEIREFESKLLAIEVKYLRDSDPSGSLAKSIGQAVLYKTLGFEYSCVLLVDCRSDAFHHWTSGQARGILMPSSVGLAVFGRRDSKIESIATLLSPTD